MSFSRRRLLTNFYSSINKKYDGDLKKIFEDDKKYLIKENSDGTKIKTGDVLNGIEVIPELLSNEIDYIVIDESYINKDIVFKCLEIISNIIDGNNVDKFILDSKELIGSNTSFLFKKTIYKVKGDK